MNNEQSVVAAAADSGCIRHHGEILPYTLRYTSRRTLAIVVHHDGAVVIRAPRHIARSEAVSFLLDKAGWVKRKRREFQSRRIDRIAYRYAAGERHAHLGEWLELIPQIGERSAVQHDGDKLIVTIRNNKNAADSGSETAASAQAVARQLTLWRRRQAAQVFAARLAAMWDRFERGEHHLPELKIRRMQRRWGSLIGRRLMILNLSLIKTPVECIDFVVLHELCHLYHRRHDRYFYQLLDRHCPEWKERREKLYSVAID